MKIFLCVPMLAHLMVLVSKIEKHPTEVIRHCKKHQKQRKASAPQAKQLLAHK
jgi:hypothetical protein